MAYGSARLFPAPHKSLLLHREGGQIQKNTFFYSLFAYVNLRAYSCLHYEMYAIKELTGCALQPS